MIRVEQADHNFRHNIQKRRVVRDYALSTYSGLESNPRWHKGSTERSRRADQLALSIGNGPCQRYNEMRMSSSENTISPL